MKPNPCLECGACCASFRASFYWAETTMAKPDGVPEELVDKLNDFRVVMKGTNQPEPRCIALEGKIGCSVRCAIHPRRASICRDFPASFEDGKTVNERCDAARAKHGMPPLKPEDWTTPSLPDIPDAA